MKKSCLLGTEKLICPSKQSALQYLNISVTKGCSLTAISNKALTITLT